ATRAQLQHVRDGNARLCVSARVRSGDGPLTPIGVPAGRGFFVAPTLFQAAAADAGVHEREVFGPVASVIGYSGSTDDAAAIVARARGALVASLYSDDADFVRTLALELAPHHGRLFLGSGKIAEVSP